MDIIIVTVEGVTNDGEVIASQIRVVTDDPATADVDDIVEYYRKRLPLTVKAMGL